MTRRKGGERMKVCGAARALWREERRRVGRGARVDVRRMMDLWKGEVLAGCAARSRYGVWGIVEYRGDGNLLVDDGDYWGHESGSAERGGKVSRNAPGKILGIGCVRSY